MQQQQQQQHRQQRQHLQLAAGSGVRRSIRNKLRPLHCVLRLLLWLLLALCGLSAA
jgi:hypothetical protein